MPIVLNFEKTKVSPKYLVNFKAVQFFHKTLKTKHRKCCLATCFFWRLVMQARLRVVCSNMPFEPEGN